MEWSEAAVAAARQHFHDGLSAKDAAIRLGTSRNAVLGKWYRLGLRRKPIRAGQDGGDSRSEDRLSAACGSPAAVGNPIDFGSLSGLCASIESLETGMCCWPIGDPLRSGFSYCGRPSLSRRSYCQVHHARAYVSPATGALNVPTGSEAGFRRAS